MYALLTPVRNEETYLPFVVDRVRQQTCTPDTWLFVDDGSDDATPELIEELSETVPWIEGLRLDRNDGYDTEFGYARVVAAGIDYLTAESDVEYLGILDCDNLVRDDYFETLISEMQSRPDCGVASGLVHSPQRRDTVEDVFPGSAMLVDGQCLSDIGTYPISPSPDSVLLLKAENRGWEALKTDATYGVELREAQSARGLWGGYRRQAEGRYYLNYHPVNAFLTGVYHTLQFPYYPGIAYLTGYFGEYLRDADRTDDAEVRRYFGEQRFRNLKRRAIDAVVGRVAPSSDRARPATTSD